MFLFSWGEREREDEKECVEFKDIVRSYLKKKNAGMMMMMIGLIGSKWLNIRFYGISNPCIS